MRGHKRFRLAFGAACIALTLALSACSGSKSTSAPSGPPPLSKAAYIAKGNAICQAMVARIKTVTGPIKDVADAAKYSSAVAQLTASSLNQLRALRVPAGETAQANAMYASVDTLATDMARTAAVMRTGDRAAVGAELDQLKVDSKAADDASRTLGLVDCGH
jgi:hypothetical protein